MKKNLTGTLTLGLSHQISIDELRNMKKQVITYQYQAFAKKEKVKIGAIYEDQ